MNEIEHLAEQHSRALGGPAWHGPSILELLKGVSAARAAARPIPGAHSIWELVLHIRTWDRVVLARLRGESFKPTPEENWPSIVGASPKSWKRAVREMTETHRKLNQAISALSGARLSRTLPGKNYPLHHLVYGVIQHELYHAGQIGLLKKA